MKQRKIVSSTMIFAILSSLLMAPEGLAFDCNQFGESPENALARKAVNESTHELKEASTQVAEEIKNLEHTCQGNIECLENGAKKIVNSALEKSNFFWTKFDKNVDRLLCLKGGRGSKAHAKLAFENYYKTSGITLVGIGIGWSTGAKEQVTIKDKDGNQMSVTKKPYALIGEAILSEAIFAEAACRNTAGQNTAFGESNETLGQRLKNYITPVLGGSLIFTGLAASQDYLIYDQKDAFSKEKLKEYYYLGLASVMFEAFYAVGHAVRMDDIMVNGLPQLRQTISTWIKSPQVQKRLERILKSNGKNLAELEAEIISHVAETALRVSYFSIKINAWTHFADSVIPKLKESPLFNFAFDKEEHP